MGNDDGERQRKWGRAPQHAGRWLRRHALYIVAAVAGVLMLSVAGTSAALLLYQRTSPPYEILNPATPLATSPTRIVATPSCGTSTTPACPTPGPDWIPIASDTPQAVLAAAKQSTLFTVDRSGDGDYFNLSHIGMPQLISEYRVAGWYTTELPLSQYYAIPVLDDSGTTVAVAMALLNSAHTAIFVGAINGVDPVPNGAVCPVSRAAAIADVQAQRRTGLRPGATAQLVYIPSDPAIIYRPTTPLASGASPADPVWRVPGANGQDYVVGTDGHVFSIADLEAMAHR